jgi:cytochrome c biogenesis DsbD-like protein
MKHKQTRATLILLTLVCCLFAGCAKPKQGDADQQSSANEPPRVASVDVVKVAPEELTLAKGESGYAIVRLQIQNGYHINANPASYPYLIATDLQVPPAEGIGVDFISYPNPQTRQFAFAEKPLAVYEGEAVVKAMLKANASASPGKHNLSAKLRVQACDEQVCYAPGVIDLTLPLTVR